MCGGIGVTAEIPVHHKISLQGHVVGVHLQLQPMVGGQTLVGVVQPVAAGLSQERVQIQNLKMGELTALEVHHNLAIHSRVQVVANAEM